MSRILHLGVFVVLGTSLLLSDRIAVGAEEPGFLSRLNPFASPAASDTKPRPSDEGGLHFPKLPSVTELLPERPPRTGPTLGEKISKGTHRMWDKTKATFTPSRSAAPSSSSSFFHLPTWGKKQSKSTRSKATFLSSWRGTKKQPRKIETVNDFLSQEMP
ncbi:MAG: hypothetical protein R3E01_23945 [Pirellulaceae bacterium]|nr:hypothetical protein [Planctomycetales bacterium]